MLHAVDGCRDGTIPLAAAYPQIGRRLQDSTKSHSSEEVEEENQ